MISPGTSLTRKNKKGERGSPWRIPLDAVIRPLGLPLMKTENFGFFRQPIIHEIYMELNFFRDKIFSKKFQSVIKGFFQIKF